MLSTYGPVLDALRVHGLDEQQLADAIDLSKKTGMSLRDVLLKERILTPWELAKVLAAAYGMGYADLRQFPIDEDAVSLVPTEIMVEHLVLAIAIDPFGLTVASADPGDIAAIHAVRTATGLNVRAVVAATDDLTDAINRVVNV
jgi:type IV pilus assembly protein PilB